MPKAKEKHREEYTVTTEAEKDCLDDVKQLLQTINRMSFKCKSTKKRMLKRVIWLAVELTGNFCCRYRSDGVLNELNASIQRDHVFPRKELIELLRSDNPDYDKIAELAQTCCIVTVAEHRQLTRASSKVKGWNRYKKAGVIFRDMRTYRWMSPDCE